MFLAEPAEIITIGEINTAAAVLTCVYMYKASFM